MEKWGGVRFPCRHPTPFIRTNKFVSAWRAWSRRSSFHRLKKTVQIGRLHGDRKRPGQSLGFISIINRPFSLFFEDLVPLPRTHGRRFQNSRDKAAFRSSARLLCIRHPRTLGSGGERSYKGIQPLRIGCNSGPVIRGMPRSLRCSSMNLSLYLPAQYLPP